MQKPHIFIGVGAFTLLLVSLIFIQGYNCTDSNALNCFMNQISGTFSAADPDPNSNFNSTQEEEELETRVESKNRGMSERELRERLKKEILSEVRKEFLPEIRKGALNDVRKEVLAEVRKEILAEVQKGALTDVKRPPQTQDMSEEERQIEKMKENQREEEDNARDDEIYELQERVHAINLKLKLAQTAELAERLGALEETVLDLRSEGQPNPDEIKTVTKPRLPARMEIGGLKTGSKIIVSGTYLGSQLAVELLWGTKIAFHLSLREELTVLNDRYDDWGPETHLQVSGKKGESFNIELKVFGNEVIFFFNHKRVAKWEFRRSFDLNQIREVTVSCKDSCAVIETLQAIKTN